MNRQRDKLLQRAGALALWLVVIPLLAQTSRFGISKGLRVPQYYSATELAPGQTNQVKTLLRAAEAVENPDHTISGRQIRIENYDPSGETNLIVMAPASQVDIVHRVAWSPGPLEVQSGDGRFFLEGEGFFCNLTNATLQISNRVRTLIQKDVAPENLRKP